jgi:hypothetical protein
VRQSAESPSVESRCESSPVLGEAFRLSQQAPGWSASRE